MKNPLNITLAIKIKNTINDYDLLKDYSQFKSVQSEITNNGCSDVHKFTFNDGSMLKCVDLTGTSHFVRK